MCYWDYDKPIRSTKIGRGKPIIAYKALTLRLSDDELEFTSPQKHVKWKGFKHNIKDRYPTDFPAYGSGTGIYCLKDYEDTVKYLTKDHNPGNCIVKLELRGTVHEFKARIGKYAGYKAEKAKIVELSYLSTGSDAAENLYRQDDDYYDPWDDFYNGIFSPPTDDPPPARTLKVTIPLAPRVKLPKPPKATSDKRKEYDKAVNSVVKDLLGEAKRSKFPLSVEVFRYVSQEMECVEEYEAWAFFLKACEKAQRAAKVKAAAKVK